MNHPRCGYCAFSASFVRECTDVGLLVFVAEEEAELTVHKESVIVEEISSCAIYLLQKLYRIGLPPLGHAPSRFPSRFLNKLRRLLHKRRKVRVFVWKGIGKNIISHYSSACTINPQPRR